MASSVDFPLDIATASRLLQTGELTAGQLAEACLARIERHDGKVHSFVHLDRTGALQSAGAPDRETRSPLAGIPIGLKDIFDVAGLPASGNSRVFAGRVASNDAASVARLRAAGAVIVGKQAAWECAMGGTSFSLPWPPARNPWDLERDPGGSSTGSAAALAAGFCLGALGSDTGGSIREPAAWCGVAGLKPTYGLVSTRGAMAASFSLDHVGPMARTSLDCAMLLDALTASEPGTYSGAVIGGLDGLRVGVVDLDREAELDLAAEVADAVTATGRALEARGGRLSSVKLPSLQLFSAVCTLLASVEGLLLHRDTVATVPHLYDPLTRQRLLAGQFVSATDYVAADCVRGDLIAAVLAAMADVDVLLMPTTRTSAPMLGGFDSHAGHPSLGRPWNVAGFPALSVRAGFDRGGLPLAVQIIGRPYADALVLRCGHAVERAQEDRDRWPDLAGLRPAADIVVRAEESGDAVPSALAAVIERAAERVRGALTSASQPSRHFIAAGRFDGERA